MQLTIFIRENFFVLRAGNKKADEAERFYKLPSLIRKWAGASKKWAILQLFSGGAAVVAAKKRYIHTRVCLNSDKDPIKTPERISRSRQAPGVTTGLLNSRRWSPGFPLCCCCSSSWSPRPWTTAKFQAAAMHRTLVALTRWGTYSLAWLQVS